MAISTYEKDGQRLWKVYVNLRSKVNPTVRVQKVVVDLKSETAAIAEEKKLLKLLSQEVLRRERRGLEWETVIDRWEAEMRKNNTLTGSGITLTDYVNMLRKRTAGWLKRPANEITRADVKDILRTMEQEGRSANYQRKTKAAMNHVFTWAVEGRIVHGVEESPASGVSVCS